jgi:hypothetical protein
MRCRRFEESVIVLPESSLSNIHLTPISLDSSKLATGKIIFKLYENTERRVKKHKQWYHSFLSSKTKEGRVLSIS